jgi:hypothetical protein
MKIFVATLMLYTLCIEQAYANCRVAGKDIVCDNSTTLIDTYNALIPRPIVPVPIYIVNQPIELPQISSRQFDSRLLDFDVSKSTGEEE